MGAFISLVNLANSLQQEVVNAVGNDLIEQAEGLVIEVIGDQSPWTPASSFTTPRTVALRAAGRPLRNPKGLTDKQVDGVRDGFPDERLGVYLDEYDRAELADWLQRQNPTGWPRTPVGSFPDPLCYPDPARPRFTTGTALTDYE